MTKNKKQTPSRLKTEKKIRKAQDQENYNLKHGIKPEQKKSRTSIFPYFLQKKVKNV